MSRITENQETLLANARGAKRQDRTNPFVIREDGQLLPNVPLIRAKGNFRVYTGDPNASLAERQAWLRGQAKRRHVTYLPGDSEPFDLNSAGIDDVLAFAMDEYGLALDPNKSLKQLKAELWNVVQAEQQGGMGQGIGSNRPGGDGTGTIRNVTEGTGTQNAGHRPSAESREGAGGMRVLPLGDGDLPREGESEEDFARRQEQGRVTSTRKVEAAQEGELRGQQEAEAERRDTVERNRGAAAAEKRDTAAPVAKGKR